MNKKTYNAVISGNSDNNIDFNDYINLVEALGFILQRQNGSHMIFKHSNGAYLNVQKEGSKAKGYQVKQLRILIEKYGM